MHYLPTIPIFTIDFCC